MVLVFGTAKYFESRACAREIFRAVLLKKPLIAVLEPDVARGGLGRQAIEDLLIRQRYTPHGKNDAASDQTWAAKWGLDDEVREWGFAAVPTGAEIAAALF